MTSPCCINASTTLSHDHSLADINCKKIFQSRYKDFAEILERLVEYLALMGIIIKGTYSVPLSTTYQRIKFDGPFKEMRQQRNKFNPVRTGSKNHLQ